MRAIEREHRYLISRALREKNRDLARKLVENAMKYDLDLSDLVADAS